MLCRRLERVLEHEELRMIPDGGIGPGDEEWETARAFALLYRIPFVDLVSVAISDEILAVVPAKAAIEHLFIPLDTESDGTLLVVVSDPSVPRLRERLSEILGAKVDLSVTPRSWLNSAIQSIYGKADQCSEN